MRVYTEAGVHLEGDIPLAKSYVSYARTLLGMMGAFNNNLQVQNWSRVLPDGTKIYLSSIHGNKIIHIIAKPDQPEDVAKPYFLFTFDDGTNYSQYSPLINSSGNTLDLVEVSSPYTTVAPPRISLRGEGSVRNGPFSWSLPYGSNLMWRYDQGGGQVGSIFYHENEEYFVDAAGGDPLFGAMERDGVWYAFTYSNTSTSFYIQTSVSTDLGATWIDLDYKYPNLTELNSLNTGGIPFNSIRFGDCSPAWSISHTTDSSKVCICVYMRARAGVFAGVVLRYEVDVTPTAITWTPIELSWVEYYVESAGVANYSLRYIFEDLDDIAVRWGIGDYTYSSMNSSYTGNIIIGAEYDANDNLLIATFEPGLSQLPSKVNLPDEERAGMVQSGSEYLSSVHTPISLTEAVPITFYGGLGSAFPDYASALAFVKAEYEVLYAPLTLTYVSGSESPNGDIIVGSIGSSETWRVEDPVNPFEVQLSVTYYKGYPWLAGEFDTYFIYKSDRSYTAANSRVTVVGVQIVNYISGNLTYSEGYIGVKEPYFADSEYIQEYKRYNIDDAPWYIRVKKVPSTEVSSFPYSSTLLSDNYAGSLFPTAKVVNIKIISIFRESPAYTNYPTDKPAHEGSTFIEFDWVYDPVPDGISYIQDIDIQEQVISQFATFAVREESYSPAVGNSGRLPFPSSYTLPRNYSDDIYQYRLMVHDEELVGDIGINSVGSSGTVTIAGGLPSFSNIALSSSNYYTSTVYDSLLVFGPANRTSQLSVIGSDTESVGIYQFNRWNDPTGVATSGLFKYNKATKILSIDNDIYVPQYSTAPLPGFSINLLSIKKAQ